MLILTEISFLKNIEFTTRYSFIITYLDLWFLKNLTLYHTDTVITKIAIMLYTKVVDQIIIKGDV